MVRRLTDIDLEEVSLVDEGAVKRKFLIVKKQNKEVKVDELTLEDVEEAEVEKKLSEKGTNAIKGALKILKPYMDELTPKMKEAVGVLAGAAGYGEAEGYEYAEPKKEETEKAGRKLSKTTVEKIQSIIKELSSLIEEVKETVEPAEVKKAEIDWDEVSKHIQTRVKELIAK